MAVDGWTAPNGGSVTGIAIDDKLVDCVVEEERHTGEFLEKIITEQVLKWQESLKVIHVCLENCSESKSA